METAKEIIEIVVNSQSFAAIIGFLGAILAQYLLRKQISSLEIKKFQLGHKKENLEKLKNMGEGLIKQIYAYDELANHITITLYHGLHDENRLKELESKLKSLKEDISPKLQIYFHDIADIQNEYSIAIAKFNNSFFEGLKYEGLKQKGYLKEDMERMKNEHMEIQEKKHALVVALINFLSDKEKEIME